MSIPKPGLAPETGSSPQPPIPTATLLPNAQTIDVSIWVPPYLSEAMGTSLDAPLRELFVSDPATANIRVEVGEQNIVSQRVYALVMPFSSTLQGVSSQDLMLRWQGQTGTGSPLLMPP